MRQSVGHAASFAVKVISCMILMFYVRITACCNNITSVHHGWTIYYNTITVMTDYSNNYNIILLLP